MSTAMIALVGEQPLPNLLPIRHYRPRSAVLIYTARTREVFERLSQTLGQETLTIRGVEVDPYNIIAIEQAICAAIRELEEHELLFNLTGGTKAMALAAYRVAEQRQAEVLYLESERGQSLAYRYDWINGALHVGQKETLPACLTLSHMLNVHLGPGMWQERGPSRQEGGPFEKAIADALRPVVDEVMVGVNALGQIDIDVAVRLGNQFGIIEAKDGEKGSRLDGIKQLSNAWRHLGTFTQQFYVITVEPNKAHEALVDASRIQVISLPSYQTGERVLPEADARRLADDVRDRLQGSVPSKAEKEQSG
jgi:hypothetical protein